jgi:hypothetical protein
MRLERFAGRWTLPHKQRRSCKSLRDFANGANYLNWHHYNTVNRRRGVKHFQSYDVSILAAHS